jgi:3-hydroxyethyl bacteriochlorophyllide a dehydrogenase
MTRCQDQFTKNAAHDRLVTMIGEAMDTIAVVLDAPAKLSLSRVALTEPDQDDIVVDVAWSGISTGTERLLWAGTMPPFPGMGYPLVPGYEAVGRVAMAGSRSGRAPGELVFVPGARCFRDLRGVFGGAAGRLVVPGDRAVPIGEELAERGVLLALAATAYHAMHQPGAAPPQLIVGHGALGRLLARLTVLAGGEPTVWENRAERRDGAAGYRAVDPAQDERRDYRSIYDASGDAALLDTLVARLAPGGEIVLAGFYSDRLSFVFPPAFMREARLRIAAQWTRPDLIATRDLAASGRLSLDGLITHRSEASAAPLAYRTAFDDPCCLKMILDWRACS